MIFEKLQYAIKSYECERAGLKIHQDFKNVDMEKQQKQKNLHDIQIKRLFQSIDEIKYLFS